MLFVRNVSISIAWSAWSSGQRSLIDQPAPLKAAKQRVLANFSQVIFSSIYIGKSTLGYHWKRKLSCWSLFPLNFISLFCSFPSDLNLPLDLHNRLSRFLVTQLEGTAYWKVPSLFIQIWPKVCYFIHEYACRMPERHKQNFGITQILGRFNHGAPFDNGSVGPIFFFLGGGLISSK